MDFPKHATSQKLSNETHICSHPYPKPNPKPQPLPLPNTTHNQTLIGSPLTITQSFSTGFSKVNEGQELFLLHGFSHAMSKNQILMVHWQHQAAVICEGYHGKANIIVICASMECLCQIEHVTDI